MNKQRNYIKEAHDLVAKIIDDEAVASIANLSRVLGFLNSAITIGDDPIANYPWVIYIGAYRALHSDGVTRSTPLVKLKISNDTYEFIQQIANVTIDQNSLEKIYTINAVKFTIHPAPDESIKS